MSEVQVKVINRSRHPLPTYHTEHAACADVHANLDQPVTLQPMERALIPTGIYFALPAGYEMQVRPRSGLALKHGISLVNAPGTIDADFRGELAVIMINLGHEPYIVNDGERIAQILVSRYDRIVWQEVEQLDQTARGEGGYGHTGR